MKNKAKVFLTAFLIFSFTVGITLIRTKGIWVYYGDFNVQQIPFYMHLHDLVRSGNLLYDWSTDLGGSVLGCYSFYILGSPFFWLTIPFSSGVVPYLLPWINALKYGVMALSAFCYLKKHTQTEDGAFMGALLYAFSGFAGVVLVYNHFHDVMAFFPFWLLLLDKMLEEKKCIGFTLMTSFMAILNYYFFVGEVVFAVIYFFTKRPTVRGALRAILCGGIGVLLSLWYVIPAVSYTIGNSRLSDVLMGYDLLTYSEPRMLMGILKNVVLLPDISGLNSMFNMGYSRVSGLGAYIPLFSLAGVIAYFIVYKNKDLTTYEERWPKRTLIACLVFAAIPVLNALFSALNSEYYARWYYMPVLIMCMMTGRLLEKIPEDKGLGNYFATGNIFVAACVCFFAIASVMPAKKDDGTVTILGNLKNPEQLLCELIFSALMTLILFLLIYIVFPKIEKTMILKIIVSAACLITSLVMMVEGSLLIERERKLSFIEQGIKGGDAVEFPDETGWYRIETEEDVYNYPMIWNRPSITSFISTIPSSTIDFYKGLELSRKVTSKLGVTRVGARTLLSGRYFLVEKATPIEKIGRVEDVNTLSYFSLIGETNDFDIYENDYYVPMGFTFDEYVLEDDYHQSEASSATKDKLLMKALILSDSVAQKYDGYLTQIYMMDVDSVPLNTFISECDKKRENACTDFETSKSGFTATANMERDNLLFFSVPFDNGFRAYVDGVETEIECVDFGLSAVFVPEGKHNIEFKYSYLDVIRKTFKKTVDGDA